MSNRTLTDRFIQSCKPAPAGKRIDYADSVVPGLVLRVTDRGHKSFALRCRYPSHPDNPTRRALGDYGALSLDDARQKARRWLELIGRGSTRRSRKHAEGRGAAPTVTTFAAVAADFLERHAAKLARGQELERILNSEFVKRWGARPATEIMPEEVAAAICAIVRRGVPTRPERLCPAARDVPVGYRHRRVRHSGIADRTPATGEVDRQARAARPRAEG